MPKRRKPGDRRHEGGWGNLFHDGKKNVREVPVTETYIQEMTGGESLPVRSLQPRGKKAPRETNWVRKSGKKANEGKKEHKKKKRFFQSVRRDEYC